MNPSTETNRFPASIFVGDLCPKTKLTAAQRKYIRRAHEVELPTCRPAPKDPMLRLTQKLASYTAGRLVRFIKQSARRAASAKHLLAKLHPLSTFRPALEGQQKMNLVAFIAATTELENRGKTA